MDAELTDVVQATVKKELHSLKASMHKDVSKEVDLGVECKLQATIDSHNETAVKKLLLMAS